MFHIVLYQPEIPPNTGNIIRLCANTGTRLHLIEPLGFTITDKQLRRAGLDYHEWVNLQIHPSFEHLRQQLPDSRLLALSTKGTRSYTTISYQENDILLFGPETRGLPNHILQQVPADHLLRIPMLPYSRSLNLANSVAIVVYEAWRQHNFLHAAC